MSGQGVLWDLDGVLVDTGEFHFQVWAEVLQGYGMALSRGSFRQTFGRNNPSMLRVCFDAVVSGDEPPDKPQLRLFLTVACLLGVLPERCVVVEDAVAGVEAARRAGMKCIAVRTTNPAALGQADMVVDRLDALPMDVFQRLLAEAW